MFDKVCIIGFGLIGSSIAHNLRNKGLAKSVTCLDHNPEVCRIVMQRGWADHASVNAKDVVVDADHIILCVPVAAMADIVKSVTPFIKQGAVLSDVGSVKQAVIDQIRPVLPQHCFYVPAHPIAGTEYSGPEAGFEGLFENYWCILTPDETTSALALDKVYAMWQGFGAKVEIMSVSHHGTALAMISHLPHLIAFSIVGSAHDLERDLQENIVKFSAGGFRGLTRTAMSDPVMWRDIFMTNDKAVLDVLDRFIGDITTLRGHIVEKNADAIEAAFENSRRLRRALIE